MPKQRTALNAAIAATDPLTRPDLVYLRDYITGLLEAMQDEEEESDSAPTAPGQRQRRGTGGGYFETKTIKGHPYRYLRFRSDGKLCSRYRGKVE